MMLLGSGGRRDFGVALWEGSGVPWCLIGTQIDRGKGEALIQSCQGLGSWGSGGDEWRGADSVRRKAYWPKRKVFGRRGVVDSFPPQAAVGLFIDSL